MNSQVVLDLEVRRSCCGTRPPRHRIRHILERVFELIPVGHVLDVFRVIRCVTGNPGSPFAHLRMRINIIVNVRVGAGAEEVALFSHAFEADFFKQRACLFRELALDDMDALVDDELRELFQRAAHGTVRQEDGVAAGMW